MDIQKIVAGFGGTTKLAEICHVTPSAISQWMSNGIPEARLMYLKLLKPKVFAEIERQDRDSAGA